MAEVFLAVAMGPEGFQRSLVIKRMLPHLSQDRAFVRMFIDEAKLCGLLSHPNLVQIFEFGQIEESFFIAMEHVNGETLASVRTKLNETGRAFPAAAALEITRQVCVGLHYAHSLKSATGQPLGIIHRDISPSNLMLSFHGGVKILDFGIARATEELRESRTQAGTMKGKVAYMSPEQIRMEPVDCRADIFAVGVVLHEMLTGRRLFKATNEYTGSRLVLESEVPLPSSANPDMPAEVDRIVMRALERNRDARYPNAGEMAEDLEKLLFDMRASPNEPRKLLHSLFPHGPSAAGEVFQLTPSPIMVSSTGEHSGTPGSYNTRTPTPPPPTPAKDLSFDVELGRFAASGPTRMEGRPKRRKSLLVLGVLGLAAAVVVLVLPRRPPPPEMPTVPVVAVAPAHAAAEPAVPAAPPAKATVEVSLDSTPQDAQVVREDSGEVVGRTPLTITLPQAREIISFRFEKAGHAPATYKVIPDLDKSLRAELAVSVTAPAPTSEPKRGVRPPPRRPGPAVAHKGPAPAAQSAPASGTEAQAPAADQPRSCLLSVGSFPWTELWIDGKDTGQRTPVVHYPVTCGPHKLNLKRRDLKVDRVEQVTVAPGHELKQNYDLGDQYND